MTSARRTTYAKLSLIFLTGLALSSCSQTTRDQSCLLFRPILVSPGEDYFSDATARQILGHNRVYVATCGTPT